MKRSVGATWMFILGWTFLIILIAYFIQARGYYGENPIMRSRLEVIEPFQSGGAADAEPMKDPNEMVFGPITPGDPELSKPNMPYNLLNGWLSPSDKRPSPCDSGSNLNVNELSPECSKSKSLTAERCHTVDFQGRLERTGNFRQLTNNYKRGDPDSCSAPIQEMTLAFYKTEPVEQVGCIQPYVE
jgi:hypothetical protein